MGGGEHEAVGAKADRGLDTLMFRNFKHKAKPTTTFLLLVTVAWVGLGSSMFCLYPGLLQLCKQEE